MNLEVSRVNKLTSRNSGTMNLSGYEDLGVSLLKKENSEVSKRSRYLNPNSTIWPMGYGLVTSVYKYKHKKRIVNHNQFDGLPEELMLYIFKMLDKPTLIKCAFVCKEWKRITYDESLWHSLNIPCRRMSLMTLDNILRRNVRFLSISHSNIYVDNGHLFETLLPKLQYLDVSAVYINVQILNSLLNQCSNLVKLSLENCRLNQACCQNIERNTKLKVLNLSSTRGLDICGLKSIISLKNLEELNVSWAQMSDDDVHFLISNMIPTIKCLNISGFLKQIADYDLISLTRRCPQLIELDISDNLAITSDSLDCILQNQPNLKVLSMSRCYNI
ncbi:Hypothetical protein CINCED_3A000908 [Cinara cedri]|uniref:F-box domain-containing protein n=1 Tax=Cinara cedri TaxID=506608 RepID=A0A5E4M6C0_9HEMI|nr:Hypothetical protein CINCED_3A000908 [Cinara cedri]